MRASARPEVRGGPGLVTRDAAASEMRAAAPVRAPVAPRLLGGGERGPRGPGRDRDAGDATPRRDDDRPRGRGGFRDRSTKGGFRARRVSARSGASAAIAFGTRDVLAATIRDLVSAHWWLDRGDLRRDVQRQERGAHSPRASRDHRKKARPGVQVAPGRALRGHLPRLEPRRAHRRGGADRFARADRARSAARYAGGRDRRSAVPRRDDRRPRDRARGDAAAA